jgi:hypothetical protein
VSVIGAAVNEGDVMTALFAPPAPVPEPPEAPAPAFRGFRSPSYTMVPDELFDELLPDLSGAELKVLLFVVRRTFGFKRDCDRISLSQMLHGITTREGRVLHRGVGLSKPTLLGALRSLHVKGVLRSERQRSPEKGDEPTVYALRFADRPGQANAISIGHHDERPGSITPSHLLVKNVDQGGGQEPAPGGWTSRLTTQQTDPQQTQEQHHSPPPSPTSTRQKDPLAPTVPAGQEQPGAVDDDDVLVLLVSQGVTRRIAQELVRTHAEELIRQQVAWQPYRPQAKSPAGALVQAIRDAWPPPSTWGTSTQDHGVTTDRQTEEEAARREAEEARRREWEQKPPEERIAGRLQFWLLGQRRKGREPTTEDVDAKRAELLAEVAGADGVS